MENSPNQNLPTHSFREATAHANAETAAAGEGPFDRFARLVELLASTTSRLRKIEAVAVHLSDLDPEDLECTVAWLAGSPRPGRRPLHVGPVLLRRAVAEAAGVPESEVRGVGRRLGDLGLAAREILAGRGEPEPWTLGAVLAWFDSVEAAAGPVARVALLAAGLRRLSPAAAATAVKILVGQLRIGVQEALLEEALAQGLRLPVEAIREAAMLTGDLAATARLARENRLNRVALVPFRPVKAMLASPEPDAASVLARFDRPPWVEDKFDGIRAQIHAGGGRAEIYSRDLKPITAAFGEVARAAAEIGRDFVADGELVAHDGHRVLPFDRLQRRLGRRGADLFLPADVPVVCMLFDLLRFDGVSLVGHPLRERRKALASFAWPPPFHVVPTREVRTVADLEVAFAAARAAGNEGLIAKDPASRYQPGRRGFAWVKLKQPLATLDAVVVAVEWGHGRRHAVLSDYTFALRDTETGALRIVGKAYSGLTDAEIAELTPRFLAKTRSVRGRRHEVEPEVVIEVAFDAIRESPRHDGGLALRFPRIVRVRTDKTPDEIDTLQAARALAVPQRGQWADLAPLADARESG